MRLTRFVVVLASLLLATPSAPVGADTVDGLYSQIGALAGGSTFNLTIAGRGGVPGSGVGSVALNVTAVSASGAGYLTVWPAGQGQPNASNLNVVAGQTVPNMVIVPLGVNGQISIFSSVTVDLLVDVLGWFPADSSFNGLYPARLMDTRIPPPPLPPAPPHPPPPPPPVLTFNAGTYLVNSTIPPGRYVAENARSGCYWERLSGLGGTIDEIIANDFRGFAGRVIVDIYSSDVAFEFDADCAPFKSFVASAGSPSSFIVPGTHVVGVHIQSGTYATYAAYGCYWERNSSFDGTLDSIITNDFVGTAGPQFVTISPGDVGFSSDADCGTWQRL